MAKSKPRAELLVADAGPLIALARVHRLDLPARLFSRILVPSVVLAECLAGDRPGATSIEAAVAKTPWKVIPVVVHEIPADLATLGNGEAAAIHVAQAHKGAMLLMDDWVGRRTAAARGLRVIGVLGLLVAARQQRMLRAIRPLIHQLDDAGYHLAPELVEAVLRAVGETK